MSDVATPDAASEYDIVTDEIRRWKDLAQDRIDPFIDEQGLINEYALMWHLKDSSPLHYVVFKQTAVHIPHEANVEQVFSTAGRLSDAYQDPHHLARLTSIARNKKVYKPPAKEVFSRYFRKFSKASKLAFEEENSGLDVCEEEEE